MFYLSGLPQEVVDNYFKFLKNQKKKEKQERK